MTTIKRFSATVLVLAFACAGAHSQPPSPTAPLDAAQTATLVSVAQETQVALLLEQMTRRFRPQTVVFVDVNVISVTDGAVREHQTVVVQSGRFAAVGPNAEVTVPKDALVVDGAGQFLLPGLTDMHVHSLVSNSQKLLNLANGVTTVRDMDGFPFLLKERSAIARNEVLAPNFYVTGTILNAVPMGNYARVVATPEEARTAVREQKRDGYDFIKVHNLVPFDIYEAILDEAHLQSIDVVGHIPHDVKIADAIRLGQRTFEHFKGYYYDATLDMTTEDYVGLTRGADVWNCPTFYTARDALSRDEAERLIATSDEMRYVPAADKKRWLAHTHNEPNRNRTLIRDHSEKIFKDLLAVDARFIAGTDSGGGYSFHVPGFSLQHELETMESLGMRPADVLRAATTNAADAMRRQNEFGTIAVGKRADCLLASKNPLETVSNLRAPKGVMVRGVWLSPKTIDEVLARLAAVYADDARLVGADPLATLRTVAHDVERLHSRRFAAYAGWESTVDALGNLLLDLNLQKLAVRTLRNNLEDFPTSASAHASLAAALLKQGDKKGALGALDKALDLDPQNSRAHQLAETDALRRAPAFDPTGTYEFDLRVIARGSVFKTIHVQVAVEGPAMHYSGAMSAKGFPDVPLSGISAVGTRLWATAVRPDGPIEFAVVVTGSKISGVWNADFGGGRFEGTKTAHTPVKPR